MAIILNLETATTNCSVSVGKDGSVLAIKEYDSPQYSHAEKLHQFIQEVIQMADVGMDDLEAVAVSMGPGSYTGLRIGVSAAKGLCFALDIPLIAIPTLSSMVRQQKLEKNEIAIPLLDARRMEVYAAVFDSSYRQLKSTWAEVINAASFSDYMGYERVFLMGSGAQKCSEVLQATNIVYRGDVVPSSREMVPLSEKKFKEGNLEDVAYFEPFYLKDFVLQQKKT